MPRPPTAKARTGATKAGMMTFSTRPETTMASARAATSAEPTTPPMSAWDELEGSPKYQVTRFHVMAPISPANTTVGVMNSALTMPLAMVAATASEMNAPTKFRIAAIVTATRGGRARVEIDVATALAVSWNPLVKSKASAVAMTIARMMSSGLSDLVRAVPLTSS